MEAKTVVTNMPGRKRQKNGSFSVLLLNQFFHEHAQVSYFFTGSWLGSEVNIGFALVVRSNILLKAPQKDEWFVGLEDGNNSVKPSFKFIEIAIRNHSIAAGLNNTDWPV